MVTNKKNKIIACFYVFLAVTLVTSFIYIDSTYVCDDFYPTKECEKPGAIDPDTVRLTFEPEAGKDWVRPTLQFANPKLNFAYPKLNFANRKLAFVPISKE